jgi:hypothetical protein
MQTGILKDQEHRKFCGEALHIEEQHTNEQLKTV